MLMTQSLSLDFLCAKTEETEVCLDPLPKTFENLCFVKSNISQVKLSNASIKELDIREARFDAWNCCVVKFWVKVILVEA